MSEKGVSTLSAIGVWFDPTVMRLNNEERGDFLGEFKKDDRIISIYLSGNYRITGYELTTHFEDNVLLPPFSKFLITKSWIIVRKYDRGEDYLIYSISDQPVITNFLKKKEDH